MKKLRLLWMSDSPILNTGFAKVTRELLGRLSQERRYEIVCLGWFHNPQSSVSQRMPYPIFAADSQTYGQRNFQQAVTHFQPDVVVTVGDIWMIDWVAETKCREDFVWMGYVPVDGEPLPSPWVDILAQMDGVIGMSQFGQDLIRTACPTLNPACIPLGVDTTVFQPLGNREALREQEGLSDRFVVGCVARNQPRKQLPLLLQAFARLQQAYPESWLYLHTDPHDAAGWDLEELISRYALADKVTIPSTVSALQGVDESDLNHIYNLFDVFVLPTMAEGFGLPLLESMAAGVPVVATDCSSCRELVAGHGELIKVKAWLTTAPYGIQYALADVVHLEQRLKLLKKQPSLRARYRELGHAFAQKFEWNHLIGEWHSLLEQWIPRTKTLPSAGSHRTSCGFFKPYALQISEWNIPSRLPDRHPRREVVIRLVGLGDVIMTLPAVRALKKRHGDQIHLTYVTSDIALRLLHGQQSFIDRALGISQIALGYSHPPYGLPELPAELAHLKPHQVYNLINRVDFGEIAWRKPRADNFADLLGVKIEASEAPLLWMYPEEEKWAQDTLEANGLRLDAPIIVCQLNSHGKCRFWPEVRWMELASLCQEAGYQLVFLSDDPFQQRLQAPNVINTAGQLSVSEYIALISQSDVIISPDSAGIHIGGSLSNVQVLGLFGSTDPYFHTKYYSNVQAIWAKWLPCAPCWDWQVRNDCYNQPNLPWCLDSISAQMVMEQVERIISRNHP